MVRRNSTPDQFAFIWKKLKKSWWQLKGCEFNWTFTLPLFPVTRPRGSQAKRITLELLSLFFEIIITDGLVDGTLMFLKVKKIFFEDSSPKGFFSQIIRIFDFFSYSRYLQLQALKAMTGNTRVPLFHRCECLLCLCHLLHICSSLWNWSRKLPRRRRTR